MYQHFSLRSIRAAMSAVQAFIARTAESGDEKLKAEAAELLKKPVEMPASLQGKTRRGMSASSGYARWRGARFRTVRLGRPTGPGSYAEMTPNQEMRSRRAKDRFNSEHV